MHKKIDVYDFDGTIYDGDSTVDLFFFTLFRNPRIIVKLPLIFWYACLYLLHIVSLQTFKSHFFSFVTKIKDIDQEIELFWQKKEKKINTYFLENMKEKKATYVISASPEFLLKPFLKKWKNISVIASVVDKKTGVYTGKNCKGEEKIKRLDQKVKKYEIEHFYSDSLHDLPLANISKKSYFVTHGKVEEWDTEKITRRKEKKRSIIFFFLFLFIYFLISVLFIYCFQWEQEFDTLFQMDTGRILDDMGNILADHTRLSVHPIVSICLQPIIHVLTGITQNLKLSIMIFSSIIGALSVAILYRFAKMYIKSEFICTLIVMIFGFTFGNILFSASPELYNLAALGMILFWYHISLIIKEDNPTKLKKYELYLIIFGIWLAGVTVTNIVVFCIGCFILWISKKYSWKQLLKIFLVVAAVVLSLIYLQRLSFANTPVPTEKPPIDERSWMDFDINIQSVKNVVKGAFYQSFVSTNLQLTYSQELQHYIIEFGQMNKITLIMISTFYVMVALYVVKNWKKHWKLNLGLFLTLMFNFILHLVYGNATAYLYMEHFLYIPFLFLIINYQPFKKSKQGNRMILCYFLFLFLYELYFNVYYVKSIFYNLKEIAPHDYLVTHFGVWQIVIATIILLAILSCLSYLLYQSLRKVLKREDTIKHAFYLYGLFIAISAIFIGLYTMPYYNLFFGIDVRNEVDRNYDLNHEKKTEKNVTEYLDKKLEEKGLSDFKKQFPQIVQSYEDYKQEYIDLVSKYQVQLNRETAITPFYYFGMGNRRKIIYENGVLKDAFSGKVIKSWKVKYDLIVPNEYQVIIKTEDGEYVRILENKKGVWFEENGKKQLISGTDIELELYGFQDQDYENIKKVLYQEILMNVKDGKVYPNILAYDQVWYRDMAFAGLVFKNTNNLSLIKDYIANMDQIYDMQNHGEKEPDNLGQVLFLQSLISNPNQSLIEEVKEEAERISEDGYIKGTTDGAKLYDYQNSWYLYGINALNETTDISYEGDDGYTSTIWWYDTNSDGKQMKNENLIHYPYLAWAQYHKNHKGDLYIGGSLYPLSYEQNASMAQYDNMKYLNESFRISKLTPTHTWSAAEMLLFLLDETNDLKWRY